MKVAASTNTVIAPSPLALRSDTLEIDETRTWRKHVDGIPAAAHDCLTSRQRQTGAELILNAIARDIGNGTEMRIVLGERAEGLAQVAAEEGADLIVLGSRSAGIGNRKLRCTLACELEAATPVPVVVAPPATRKRSNRRLSMASGASTR
jgi:nucleotide-binding universal stress UspA family protein